MGLKLSIPRGIIYHALFEDVKWLMCAIFSRLNDKNQVMEFERAFAKLMRVKHTVAFPFARTAIYFALKSQHFEKGAEIIMPPITIKGILDVVMQLGLKPVFVDLDPDTLCFDEAKFSEAINQNTKAVLFTYLFGIVPNMQALMVVAKKHQLFVIEDFSQCLNGEFNQQKVGTFGDVGIYSASSIKTLDTYGGGLLVTNRDDLYQAMLQDQSSLQPASRKILIGKIFTDLIRNLATNRLIFTMVVIHLLKVLNRISQDSLVKQTGERQKSMISKMPEEWFQTFTSLQARVGLAIIPRLLQQDGERIRNVEQLKSTINPQAIAFPQGVQGGKNVYWQLIGYIKNHQEVQRKLQRFGVDTARSSLLQISDLKTYPYQGDTPNATVLYHTGYFVPSYPNLSADDLTRVAKAFNSLLEQRSR